jgi:hypothetical protein
MVRLRYHRRKMDPSGNDEIAQLLRLKHYQQPPPAYFENFLSEFRRRQLDEFLRQPVWRICFERAHGFALRHNVRPYPAGVAVVVACAAVISIRIYQQPEHVQVAVESSPVPSTPPANAQREFNLAPPAVPRLSTQSRFFCPEGGIFRCCRLTYSGPINLPRSSSNGNHSTISHCQKRNKAEKSDGASAGNLARLRSSL